MPTVSGPRNGKEAEKGDLGSREKARGEQRFRPREESVSGQKLLYEVSAAERSNKK